MLTADAARCRKRAIRTPAPKSAMPLHRRTERRSFTGKCRLALRRAKCNTGFERFPAKGFS